METTNLQLIKDRVLNPDRNNRIEESGMREEDRQMMVQSDTRLKDAKNFYLDVEKSQSIYDEVNGKGQIHDTQEGHFILPFDNCLFAFNKPLKFVWRDGVENSPTRNDYIKKELLGFHIYKLSDNNRAMDINGKDIFVFQTRYVVMLYFNEDKKNFPLSGDLPVIGEQYLIFGTFNIEDKPQLVFTQERHYPCGNSFMCVIKPDGTMKYPNVPRAWVCDEIVARDAFMEFVQKLCEKIFEVTIEDAPKKKKLPFTYSNEKYSLAGLPLGWPYTKGNLPKDNYVQYMDSKRYKYAKEDINLGSGIKHRYRYDVRRFPRVVKGKIVWIEPHQRGSGKYIPKVYSNHKTWFINYFWYQAEKLTKYRMFEILMVRLLTLFRNKR